MRRCWELRAGMNCTRPYVSLDGEDTFNSHQIQPHSPKLPDSPPRPNEDRIESDMTTGKLLARVGQGSEARANSHQESEIWTIGTGWSWRLPQESLITCLLDGTQYQENAPA
ncbi:hypothetical protein PSHT_14172 [Puccinia striiformis]|uniref:Uncharacterized protein n=1 Tax=Puccinia striiformis TaxID=27350 RepID=A0A2S4ULI6_9BASI|nr:hypothetical protein PSHT_14172 [Puccinia striiformis]